MGFPTEQADYADDVSQRASNEDDRFLKESEPDHESLVFEVLRGKKRTYRAFILFTLLNTLILCVSVVFFAASRRNVCEAGNSDVKNSLLKATSEPSPLLDLIDISLISKRMNGSLLETNPKNIYRQSPSPEVDAAWGRIQTRDSIVITREDVIRMGKDPEDASKYPEWMGLGSDAYIAKVDVFHQIHCLNTLRKNLHKNYDYYYDKPEDKFQDLHVSHCLVNLLENLMCYGNVDVYTHVWNDAQIHPFADFNINHKCRDFDAILAWQKENAIPLDSWSDARPPDDYKVHVMSHEFKEVLHWYDDHPNVYFEGGETA